jgi:Holliday junction DNA helicase RuvB
MNNPQTRVVDPKLVDEDSQFEPALRPKRLVDFVGQSPIKDNLSVYITAAKSRSEPLDHILLKGPPGLGKTTLAFIIANELEQTILVTSGPAVERPADLAAILTNLEPGAVLFIDEIHRLSRAVEEILYPAMEDYRLDIVTGKGAGARSIRLALKHFTLVGATTRAGLLTGPLRDRFGIVLNFDFYDVNAIETIIHRSADILNIPMAEDGALELAKRSRGTPRVANRLLRRSRDFAHHLNKNVIDKEVAEFALKRLAIDENGLDAIDRNLLSAIIEKFSGGPVGLETLAATVAEDPGTIEDVYEPFLMQKGFIQRTPRGRVACEGAYKLLGKNFNPQQNQLFDAD